VCLRVCGCVACCALCSSCPSMPPVAYGRQFVHVVITLLTTYLQDHRDHRERIWNWLTMVKYDVLIFVRGVDDKLASPVGYVMGKRACRYFFVRRVKSRRSTSVSGWRWRGVVEAHHSSSRPRPPLKPQTQTSQSQHCPPRLRRNACLPCV
jgi:hypothetical protein